MKSIVIMKREIMGGLVGQNSKTQLFRANDIDCIGNVYREEKGLGKKQLAAFFNLQSTSELINVICLEEGIDIGEVKKAVMGKFGGTWIHSILLVKLAMWYSPEFEYTALKWWRDELIKVRNDSGDSFKLMNAALTKSYGREFSDPMSYIRIAVSISVACKVGGKKDKWQLATEQQLKMRDRIQDLVVTAAELGAPNAGSALAYAVNKAQEEFSIKPIEK